MPRTSPTIGVLGFAYPFAQRGGTGALIGKSLPLRRAYLAFVLELLSPVFDAKAVAKAQNGPGRDLVTAYGLNDEIRLGGAGNRPMNGFLPV